MCLTVICLCATARCWTRRLARWTLRCFIRPGPDFTCGYRQITRRSRLSLWHAHKTSRVWHQSCPSRRWICLKRLSELHLPRFGISYALFVCGTFFIQCYPLDRSRGHSPIYNLGMWVVAVVPQLVLIKHINTELYPTVTLMWMNSNAMTSRWKIQLWALC